MAARNRLHYYPTLAGTVLLTDSENHFIPLPKDVQFEIRVR